MRPTRKGTAATGQRPPADLQPILPEVRAPPLPRAMGEGLRDGEERFRALIEQAPLGVIETDLAGTTLFANDRASTISGLSVEDLLRGRFEAAVHPDDRQRVQAERNRTEAGGKDVSFEFRLVRPDGTTRLVREEVVLLREAGGGPRGHLGFVVDITDFRAERERLSIEDRMVALGRLVAGVGHEINNPLAAQMSAQAFVLASLDDLRTRLRSVPPPDPATLARALDDAVEALRDTLEAGARISRIVKDLVALGRSDGSLERIHPMDLVRVALENLPPSLAARVRTRIEEGEAPEINGMASRLARVVQHLLMNACLAIPEGRIGELVVRIGRGGHGMARLEVTDDGVGIPPDLLGRIFDPCFTTRAVGMGMGLGLSLCHSIVASHGGRTSVRSEVGKGTTFTIELPAAPAAG